MKKIVSFLLTVVLIGSFYAFDVNAVDNETVVPYVVEFVLTTESDKIEDGGNNARATGLITSYGLSLSKSGTTLNINGRTNGTSEVVKSGFKNLTIQRRKTSSDSWEDYYEYGNVYADAFAANLSTTLVVESGYQYRISCKHYAKKNILSVQTIENTSNIVTVA